MSRPSREHLLGFLLDALAPEEQDQIENELLDNPALRAELGRLKESMKRLGLDGPPPRLDPPPGLADRTCAVVRAYSDRLLVAPARAAAFQLAQRERHFTWSDFVTMGAVVVAAASLFFPALSLSHFQANINTCQNQLRLVGYALHEFSDRQPDHRFPGPEPEGNRAAAGIVAPILVSQRLADARNFLCPGSPLVRDFGRYHMPSPEEVDDAMGPDLKALMSTMGGDFGYNMGYMEDGKLITPRDERRGNYVLAGDRPSNSQPRRVSGNHRGRGQNLLYEDGRVQFLRHLPSPQVFDDPYHNREGWVAVGLDRDDAVLGASEDPPLPARLISDGPR